MRFFTATLFLLVCVCLGTSSERPEGESPSEKSEKVRAGAEEKSDELEDVVYEEYEDEDGVNAIGGRREDGKNGTDAFPNEVFLSLRNITADAATAFRSFTNRNDVVDLQASASDNLNVTSNATFGDAESAGINLRALRDAAHVPQVVEETVPAAQLPYKHTKIDTADLSDCALQGEWKPMGVAHGHLHVAGDTSQQPDVLQSVGTFAIPNKAIPHWQQDLGGGGGLLGGGSHGFQEGVLGKPAALHATAGSGYAAGYASTASGGHREPNHNYGGYSSTVGQYQKVKSTSMLSPPPVPPVIFGKKPGYWKLPKTKHKFFPAKGRRPGVSTGGSYGYASHGYLNHAGGVIVSGYRGHAGSSHGYRGTTGGSGHGYGGSSGGLSLSGHGYASGVSLSSGSGHGHGHGYGSGGVLSGSSGHGYGGSSGGLSVSSSSGHGYSSGVTVSGSSGHGFGSGGGSGHGFATVSGHGSGGGSGHGYGGSSGGLSLSGSSGYGFGGTGVSVSGSGHGYGGSISSSGHNYGGGDGGSMSISGSSSGLGHLSHGIGNGATAAHLIAAGTGSDISGSHSGSSGYKSIGSGSTSGHLVSSFGSDGGDATLLVQSTGGGGHLMTLNQVGATGGGNLHAEAAFLTADLHKPGHYSDSTFSSTHVSQGGGNSLPDTKYLSSQINQDFAVHGQGVSDDLSSSTFTCGKNHDHNTNYHTATFQVADHDHPSSVDVLQYGGDSAVLIQSGDASFHDQLLPERKHYKTTDTEVSGSDNELASQTAQLTAESSEQDAGQTEPEPVKTDDGDQPERHSYYHEITKVTKIPANTVGSVEYTFSKYETKPQTFSTEVDSSQDEPDAEPPQIIRELEHLTNKFQSDIENPQKLFEDPPTQELTYHYPQQGEKQEGGKEETHEGITDFPYQFYNPPQIYKKPVKYIPRPGKPNFPQKTSVSYLQPKSPVVLLRKQKPKPGVQKKKNYEVQEHPGERHRPIGEIFPPQKFPKQFHNPKPNFAVDRPKNGWYQEYHSHGKKVKKVKTTGKVAAPVVVRRPVSPPPIIRVVEVTG